MAPRRLNMGQVEVPLTFDHDQLTADAASKVWKNHPTLSFRVDKAYYVNPTGLAAHGTDYVIIALKNGATQITKWSTLTGAEGTIAADTYVTLTNSSTESELILAPGDVLTLDIDAHGSPTLPPGRVVLHGRYF